MKNTQQVGETTEPHTVSHIYTWKLTDKYGTIVDYGVTKEFVEFSLDQLPGGWGGERNLDRVQETMENEPEWKGAGLQFEYRELLFMSDLSVQEPVYE